MLKILKESAAIVIGIIEVLLVVRFGLKFFGMSAQLAWVEGVYAITQPIIAPFTAIFPSPSIRGSMALEFATVFAIFAYAVIGYILQEVLDFWLRQTSSHSKQI